MTTLSITEIKSILSKGLKEERFYHSLAVSAVAASLAMRYDADIKKAELAGLIHDCAKAYPVDQYIRMADEYGIAIEPVERDNPQLIHAKLGAYYAKKNFSVDDTEILNSIKYHTTGRPNMTLMEKIIYIADYIEPGRYKAKRLD
ncbi:MAG: bis(5'-nucleosyl)-tetraphosphatase (symmetrical) YqeK, partial [Lachnospiraceae bacterium]|nr:bis(5'-nucleosyl)-tetraphosphatase (symmetrical) YqeK [Lachnospiraceae bacterium]